MSKAKINTAENVRFTDLVEAVTDEQVKDMTEQLMAAFADRAEFERDKLAENDKIQKTISGLIKEMTPGIVRALIANGTTAAIINVTEVSGKRRNVYALQKMRNVLYAVTTGQFTNAINNAIIKSMVKLTDVQLPITANAMKAAASDKWCIEVCYQPHMVRHTVSESTAPTQMSSTMTALEDLAIVKNVGTRQRPIFEFTKSPLALRLIEVARESMAKTAAINA